MKTKLMKTKLILLALAMAILSCTKEPSTPNSPELAISAGELESIKQEIRELKQQVADLTPGEDEQIISVSEFETLKQENEALKTKVESLTSGFFEVDGLRFDRNGTLISVKKLESKSEQKVGRNTLTITRTYDAEGRVIEIMRDYNTHSEFAGVPYYWQKTLYEYSGKNCKITTQTSKYGIAAGTPYEEEITESTYW